MGPTNYAVYIPIYNFFYYMKTLTNSRKKKTNLKHLVQYWHMQILSNVHGRRQAF